MAPFQYEQYRNPFVGSIGELMMQPARAQAQAELQKGAVWSNAADRIAQAVGSIPAQMQQQQEQQQRSTLIGQQVDAGKRASDDMKALDAAYLQPGGREAVINALPGHLRPTVQKAFTDADEAAAKVQETALKSTQLQNDYLGGLAASIRDHDYDPMAAQLALSHAKETYAGAPDMLAQIKQIEQRFQSDPTQIRPLVDHMIGVSEKQRAADTAKITADSRAAAVKTSQDRLALDTPKIQADTQRVQQEVAGTQPMTPAQKASNEIAQANLRVSQGRLVEEQKKNSQAAGDVTNLTPEGLDAAALNYAKTGQLPLLGMGDKQTRKQIINRAAAMMPGLDVASAKADFDANKASLTNATETLDSLSAFENTAGKNLDQFLTLADKVPDTGVPWLNTPMRALNANIVGSENQAAFNAARDVALREIARVTNDPKLSGVLSDSARHEVSALSPQNATFAQIKAVAKVLKQDMANVHSSLSDQIAGIQGRIAKGAPGAEKSTAPVRMKAPNGQIQIVPVDQVEHYKSLGATVVQ